MSVDAFGNRLAIREDLNGPAWHKLGGFDGEQTAQGTMEKFSDGIPTYQKRKVFVEWDNGFSPTSDFAIVRSETKDDPQRLVIGYCGKDYHIVQPEDIGLAFDECVKRPIETLGILSAGRKMFITWQLQKSKIVVGKDDEVNMFGTLLAGFDAKVAISLGNIAYRTVCDNTFRTSQDFMKNTKSENGSVGRVWVGRHNSKNILRDLRAWMKHVEQESEKRAVLAESLFNRLAVTPVNKDSILKSLIEQMYPMPDVNLESIPVELRNEKEEKISSEIEKVTEDRSLVEELFWGKDKTTNGVSAWDLFNNCTFYENHVRSSKKSPYNSIVFGNRSKQMNDALSVLVDYSYNKN